MGLKGETPIGIFPFFYQKTFIIKGVFSPPPKTAVPYLGPLIVDYDTLKQDKKESLYIEFQKEVDKLIFNEIKPSYVLFSLPPGLMDVRPFKWGGYDVTPNYNYIIDLSKGVEHIWNDFEKDTKRCIKKDDERVVIEEGGQEVIEIIFNALSKRYTEQKISLPLHKEYLFDLYDSFPGNIKIFIAKVRGDCVGSTVKLCYKKIILDWIGDTKIKEYAVNDILHWKTIKWAIENDYSSYELIGANTPRLVHFKSRYNPTLTLNFGVKKSTLLGNIAEKGYNILKTRRI